MASVDTEVLLWLNGWVGKFPVLDSLIQALVSDYLVPVLGSLALLGLWVSGRNATRREQNQRAVMVGVISLALSNLAIMVVNQYYFRDRPFMDHPLNMLFYQPTDSSFPANPVAVAFAIATGVWSVNRPVGLALYVIAALFAVSRVYAGVFYPSDVAAGAVIGTLVAILVRLTLRFIEPVPTMVLKLARILYLA